MFEGIQFRFIVVLIRLQPNDIFQTFEYLVLEIVCSKSYMAIIFVLSFAFLAILKRNFILNGLYISMRNILWA